MSSGVESENEIFSRRLVVSVIWNIFMQTLLAVILVLIIQVDLFHPISWITTTFADILGWKMSLNIALLGMISCFQAYIYGNYYMVPLPKYFSRFSMFLNMFTLQNAAFSTLYALSGYFTMGLYSSLAKSNYNVLQKKCEQYDGQCLIEQSLFLQFGGMWMGLYYFINMHVLGRTMLMFPHVYQDKFQQIKLTISNVISSGFRNSVMPVMYFCLFYYFWGNKPRSVVCDVYNIFLEDPPLDNLFNLISSGIFIGLWFYTSLFLISVYTMRTIFNIVLTEPMKFPVESDTNMTLSNALAQKSQFNGYLGAQDLKILALSDFPRRLQIFTLSQPGGHPRNWNNILQQSLIIINNYSAELDKINVDTKPLNIDNSSCRKSMNVTAQNLSYSPILRNMAQSPKLYDLKDHIKNEMDNSLLDFVKQELNAYLNKLCQKPGINYFFGELTDTKLKFLLMQAQPVMWVCEGLAFIAASSLYEDKYGIVQNDLHLVISALINLKHNLEKLTKLGLVPRKNILNDKFAIKMKSAVMSSVKRSLYKIVFTFSKYMKEIPLDPDVKVAIQPFLLCKEP